MGGTAGLGQSSTWPRSTPREAVCRVRVEGKGEFEEKEISNVFENLSFGKCVLFPNWDNIEFSSWIIMRSPSFCESIVPLKNIDFCVEFLIKDIFGKLKQRICHGPGF